MRRKVIGVIVMAALLLVGCGAGAMFYRQYSDAKNSENSFEQLQQMVQETGELPVLPAETETTTETTEQVETEHQSAPFDKYRALYEQNSDMVGWICIDGTNINYPVMQTPDNPNYYLKHSFEKTWSDYGVPYVDAACVMGESNNLVIYGHNMKNGSMFSNLTKYASREFFEANPVIHFDTLQEFGDYQIIAAFRYNTYKEEFMYNKYGTMNEASFEEFISNCKSRSLYDTGATAEYGDQLITLSTCEYTYKNGRFVVVAKKIVE